MGSQLLKHGYLQGEAGSGSGRRIQDRPEPEPEPRNRSGVMDPGSRPSDLGRRPPRGDKARWGKEPTGTMDWTQKVSRRKTENKTLTSKHPTGNKNQVERKNNERIFEISPFPLYRLLRLSSLRRAASRTPRPHHPLFASGNDNE